MNRRRSFFFCFDFLLYGEATEQFLERSKCSATNDHFVQNEEDVVNEGEVQPLLDGKEKKDDEY